MQVEILRLFAEAQQRSSTVDKWLQEGSRSSTTAKWSRQSHKHLPPAATPEDLEALRPTNTGVSQCPLCGGVLEHREGNPRATHIGICSM